MHITVKENLTRLQSPLHHLLRVEVDWILFLLGIRPLSIQIGTHQRAPIIAYDHTVRILHWNYFEYKFVPQKLCGFLV